MTDRNRAGLPSSDQLEAWCCSEDKAQKTVSSLPIYKDASRILSLSHHFYKESFSGPSIPKVATRSHGEKGWSVLLETHHHSLDTSVAFCRAAAGCHGFFRRVPGHPPCSSQQCQESGSSFASSMVTLCFLLFLSYLSYLSCSSRR